MAGEGQLMRLSLNDFNYLLKPPLTYEVDTSEAAELIGNGARFLDVRAESEFRDYSLPNSIHMPLSYLRDLSLSLDPKRPYIAVCQTGRRATAAAFILNQRGFKIFVLGGGLEAIKPA
jgi:rhodanese-related sulfurtransferase